MNRKQIINAIEDIQATAAVLDKKATRLKAYLEGFNPPAPKGKIITGKQAAAISMANRIKFIKRSAKALPVLILLFCMSSCTRYHYEYAMQPGRWDTLSNGRLHFKDTGSLKPFDPKHFNPAQVPFHYKIIVERKSGRIHQTASNF